jgi:phosphotransferase system HPr-like phosphotransfer protein
MRGLLGAAAGAAMALTVASSAFADSATGTVTEVNTTANTFMLSGRTYTAGANNVVGLKVSDLKAGDKVRVTFSGRDAVSGKSPINVMSITKEE